MISDYVRVKKSLVAKDKRRAVCRGEVLRVVNDRLAWVEVDDEPRGLMKLWGWEFEWIMGKGEAVRG